MRRKTKAIQPVKIPPRKYIKRIRLISAGALFLLVIRGAGIEPRLVDMREETASFPNLLKDNWGIGFSSFTARGANSSSKLK